MVVIIILIIVMATILVAEIYQLGFRNGVIRGLDEAMEEIERSQDGIQSDIEWEQ